MCCVSDGSSGQTTECHGHDITHSNGRAVEVLNTQRRHSVSVMWP